MSSLPAGPPSSRPFPLTPALPAAVSSMCVWGLLVVVGIIVFRSAQIVRSPGALLPCSAALLV